MALSIGTRLGPYEILSSIGAGGMGEVYRARDTRLDRIVAIKILRDHLADRSELRERFEREARTIASLNHPHICTLHDIGRQESTDYLVMEYLEGETLAQRLMKGPLTLDYVLQYAVQIADALDKAHRKGIAHRDLKPGNIMLTQSGAKLLDFGLAKLTKHAAVSDATLSTLSSLKDSITGEGAIVGTLQYMAPEQLEGKETDSRTDIFAFGAVVYEMATGKRAFEGKSQASLIAKILETDPPPMSSLQPMTPPTLDRVVKRCLAKDPDDRWQTARDLYQELKWIASPSASVTDTKGRDIAGHGGQVQPWWRNRIAIGIAAVFLVIAFAAAGWFFRLHAGGGDAIDSVAVLPFVNASGDPNTEYLSDGITESLINGLSQLPHLKVMSRDSAFTFKGKNADAETVGRQLGVRAVFKGRVMQQGDNLAISAELVDARDDSHIWGEQYNRKSSDIFALEGDLAKEMTAALRVRLSGDDEKRLTKNYTADPEAYQDYLKGRLWWNKGTEEGFNRGIEYFQQAIQKDPNYALAYSGLADSYSALAGSGLISAKDGYLKAKDAALRALELDDTLAEAHTSLALIKTSYDWDWSGADMEFQRAIALNPRYTDAHPFRAEALWQTGRVDEAISETKWTLQVDPLSFGSNYFLSVEFFLARQYDQLIEQERKVLELDPNYIGAYYFLGMAYLKKSMYKEAMTDFEKGLSIAPDNLVALTGLGYGYAVTGKSADAQRVLDKLNELSRHNYVSAVWRAKIYAGLGDKDKSIEWLEKAYEDRSILSVGFIKTNPIFDPLRSDPRFVELLRRTNLLP